MFSNRNGELFRENCNVKYDINFLLGRQVIELLRTLKTNKNF